MLQHWVLQKTSSGQEAPRKFDNFCLHRLPKREEVSKVNIKNCKLCSKLLACQSHLQEDASREGRDDV